MKANLSDDGFIALPLCARVSLVPEHPPDRPRGLGFARARVEMKALEAVLHLRRSFPAQMKNMIPAHVWRIVAPYGLTPDKAEEPTDQPSNRNS